jgi:hypothetical protein
LFPSKISLAVVLKKKKLSRINAALKIYGRMEMRRVSFMLEINAKEASVIPTANVPVLPTKIFPVKLKNASTRYKAKGT